MKKLRRSLNALLKNLKVLTKRTEMMMKVVDKLEKAQAKTVVVKKKTARKATAKKGAPKKVAAKKMKAKKPAAKKRKSLSATEIVLKVINRSSKGVDTAAIQKKTGFDTRKIWDIVHRASKEGKIKKIGRGTYAKS